MSEEMKGTPPGRIVSIDALRGFDMFWITGGAYFFLSLLAFFDNPVANALKGQLDHTVWHGFTFWDLIFPLFLFIVGTSMPFSLSKRIERGDSKTDLYKHIIKRTATLLFLGMVYNGLFGLNFENFRYTGVLQRIALCYCIASIIVVNSKIKTQAIIAGSVLVLYWIFMKLIPVPGFGFGDLSSEGNLAFYFDRLFLPGRFVVFSGLGDNEGLLSTLPAVSTTLMGVLSGHWLKTSRSPSEKIKWFGIAGISSLVIGLLWGLAFPINKILWTSSYVLFAGGWSILLLALFYWVIDVKGWKKWAFPFVVIGLNPITIYVAQSVFNFGIIANIFIRGFIDNTGEFEQIIRAFSVLSVKWLFLYFLYRQRIFLKA
ncbi:acyltransferase family protein [candidate division KSB1 bacterium]